MEFPHTSRRSWLQSALLICGLTLAYFCVDVALNRFAFSNGWTILWPLNGVTIAILLNRRRREWAAILLAVAVGTGIGECLDHHSVGSEIWQRLFSVTEVFLSAWLLPSFQTLDQWMRRRLVVYRFMAALVVGPGISGIMAALLFHVTQRQSYVVGFNSWATADALGIAATMPLALSIRSPELWNLFRRDQLLKTIPILAVAFGTATLIFSVNRYPLLFLLFPVLLLVETVLAFSGAAIAVFVTSLIAVYMTIHLHGPFGSWPAGLPVSRDIALQIYLGFNLVALFPASVLSIERRRMSEELRISNEQLSMLASMDGLTGIANRRSLDDAFAREWKRAIRLETPLAFLMVDIDHFKQFNDLYGHHAGDLCLKAVGEILKNHLRRSQDLAARFGGEEFAVLLPHADLPAACDLGEAIRSAVENLALRHEGSAWGCVTVSIGCSAVIPVRGEEHVEMLKSTDSALYVAKQVGRNCVQPCASANVSSIVS